MRFLLDTNIVSEVTKPLPDEGVLRFLHEADEDRLFISAVTLAEIHRGVGLLADGRRKARLAAWLTDDLPARFDGRVLPVDPGVAAAWGRLIGETKRKGVALHIMDGFIAATAAVHALTIVTRNVRDYASLGLPLLNPAEASPPDPGAAPA